MRGKRLNRGFANQCAYRARRCMIWVSMIISLSAVAQNSVGAVSFQIPRRDFVAGNAQFGRRGDEVLKFTIPGRMGYEPPLSISISYINCRGMNLIGPGGGVFK